MTWLRGLKQSKHRATFPLIVDVDEIYNLACPAPPIHCQFDPVQTTKTSVHGAINMPGLAKRVLDWTPRVALDDGLVHAITYFRNSSGGNR